MVVVSGHSSTAGGGGSVDEAADEEDGRLDGSSATETRLNFFVDCLAVRERKGKREVFRALTFRRAGSIAVGSSSACISRGRRGLEEDEAEIFAIVERGRGRAKEWSRIKQTLR